MIPRVGSNPTECLYIYKNMKWKCEYCDCIFENRKLYYEHKSEIHKIKKGQNPRYNLYCRFCNLNLFTTRSAMTLHEKCCIKNPNRIEYKVHPVSEETKMKISKSMKKAAKEGRNKGWTTTKCGQQQKSYPEIFFTKVIENNFEDKKYEYNLPFYTWKLDFAWPHKKLCIEIDGSQHERLIEQKESDLRKDAKLKEEGWSVLRIKWIDMYHMPHDYINQAKEFIDNGVIVSCTPYINPCKIKKKNENIISEETWINRKEIILNSGVDFSKYGWKSEIKRKTSLTRRQIDNTIKHFEDLKNIGFKRK